MATRRTHFHRNETDGLGIVHVSTNDSESIVNFEMQPMPTKGDRMADAKHLDNPQPCL